MLCMLEFMTLVDLLTCLWARSGDWIRTSTRRWLQTAAVRRAWLSRLAAFWQFRTTIMWQGTSFLCPCTRLYQATWRECIPLGSLGALRWVACKFLCTGLQILDLEACLILFRALNLARFRRKLWFRFGRKFPLCVYIKWYAFAVQGSAPKKP